MQLPIIILFPLTKMKRSTLLLVTLIISVLLHYQPHVLANNQTDRLSLLEIKKGITHDPDGVFNSWNDSIHFCRWQGVRCTFRGNDQRVTSLSLPELNLAGTLSPHIGNLSFLRFINIEHNTFRGQIPPQLGNLFRLQHLNASHNMFENHIPVNLSRCLQLRMLMFAANKLVGSIPEEIGFLTNLHIIRIGTNNLTGTLPPSLGNLSQLLNFGAAYNNLEGPIPETFGQLTKLNLIALGVNQLTGTIPPSLYNVSSINTMTLAFNRLQGFLPPDLGLTLTNLQEYGMGSAVSEKGDVYSYGILVLEVFTRRKPTDEMFKDGLNLHEFVKGAATTADSIALVMDPVLLLEEAADNEGRGRRTMEMVEKKKCCLVSIIEIAVACSAEFPGERTKMADVHKKLQYIRDQLLCR